ncbi:MAG: tyrosine-type recombinase/integrase [Pseudonocardia sp.]|nr:tyrosine-type recombinase/integrase [Pseudonocardia sp.]
MAAGSGARKRSRGEVEQRAGGALRVRVYAGLDPLSGKRHYLTETVPAGPKAAKQAEKVRTRLLAEVDERRNPRTSATVNQLLVRYLGVLKIEDTTRNGYERLIRLYIRPLLGDLSIGRIDGETLDAYYAELRRCRARCDRRARVDHRTDDEHECDDRCARHVCEPLGASYLRQIHTVLNGAFTRAVRWRWIGTNPVRQAEPPPQPPPDPQPPSPSQAARIVGAAWNDPDWGMFVWLAMTTGARRGELCALRWDRIDFSTGVVDIRTAVAQINTRTWEKDTKTHQRRRIVADPQTLALLRAYLQHAAQTCASLGIELAEDSFVFSGAPDHSTWMKPDTVTQRYSRMCERLGWDMHIHQLRHYSATELIAAGVDIRTVAGRLGHGGGGTTTLRVYSAWVAEADQRAASSLAARMPVLPVAASNGDGTPALPAATIDVPYSDSPYRQIAADLRAAIRCGALAPGTEFPTVRSLSARYSVSEGTAHRAMSLLSEAGEIVVSRGRRAVVADREPAES